MKFIVGSLCISGFFRATVDFNTRLPLQALTILKIRNVNVKNFKYYSQLRNLFIAGDKITDFYWFMHEFPKLNIVTFRSLNQLHDHHIHAFLKLNPQLTNLLIQNCRQITATFFDKIIKLTPNLEKLSFLTLNKTRDFNEQLIHLSHLQNLKCLFISTPTKISVHRLIDSFVENNIPIEILGFFSTTYYSPLDTKISQLKRLKKLCLMFMLDDVLIDLVKNLPELKVVIAPSSQISINGIRRALQCYHQLSVLLVETQNVILNIDDFDSILNLAKLRGVEVKFHIKNGVINVPNELLETNRKWLSIYLTIYFGTYFGSVEFSEYFTNAFSMHSNV